MHKVVLVKDGEKRDLVTDCPSRVHAQEIVDLMAQVKSEEWDYLEVGYDGPWYVHKLYTQQEYGGPEEGGWWYSQESPIDPDSDEYMRPLVFLTEEMAYDACRILNSEEYERRKDLQYQYTSVLSYRETFYTYDVTENEIYIEKPRPYYE